MIEVEVPRGLLRLEASRSRSELREGSFAAALVRMVKREPLADPDMGASPDGAMLVGS
jgi:hypothetical protein